MAGEEDVAMALEHERQQRRVDVDLSLNDDDDDDDDDLQAAIALSMQQQQSEPPTTTAGQQQQQQREEDETVAMTKLPSPSAAPDDRAASDDDNGDSPTSASSSSSSSSFDSRSFYKLMWDDATTTANDKERWIREGISTPFLKDDDAVSPQSGAAVAAATKGDDCTNDDDGANDNGAPLTPLEAFAGSSSSSSSSCPWGLIQKHGGPCGVLAAVQAEMIRVLLFGRRGRGGRDLYYPFVVVPASDDENCEGGGGAPPRAACAGVSGGEVAEAMAMGIGMILARAALAPALDGGDKSEGGRSSEGTRGGYVRVVLPAGGETSADAEPSWMRAMLAPPSSSSSDSGLRVHSISTPYDDGSGHRNGRPVNDDGGEDASPELKRPRSDKNVSFSVDLDATSNVPTITEEQRRMASLARAVANFLLSPGATAEGERTTTATATDEAASSGDVPSTSQDAASAKRGGTTLERFRGPGGVMFLMMSLASTRGTGGIRRDMDDPNATITSQFGHSSQELMNLLLTGQAVSNVFDHSMVLSEELTCHGVQSRPAVGYLTALEALRYCEVGGYYKSPLFPIWVVGSTSHFSVLFGDELCLKESKSDVLLEKCRRAFKKVEGGGENGFILVDKLGEVLDDLDLTNRIGGDNGVQTLKAYLEVSGAGIILWDDFWKASSRLMTGSSVESIMSNEEDVVRVDDDGTDGPPLLITQFGEDDKTLAAAAATTTTSTMQSDEEMARKLAVTLGYAPEDMALDPAQASTTAIKSDEDYARELQAQWDAEAAGGSSSVAATTDDIATLTGHDWDGINEEYTPTFVSAADRPSTPLPEGNMPAARDDDDADASDKDAEDAELQAQHDSKMEDTPSNPMYDRKMPADVSAADATAKAASTDPKDRLDFEKHGPSFNLYHYNGLYSGTLTKFRLTRLTPTEAVGASIALSSSKGGAGSGHGGGGSNGDLEDVVRTKWPSGMVNWFGKHPPSID